MQIALKKAKKRRNYLLFRCPSLLFIDPKGRRKILPEFSSIREPSAVGVEGGSPDVRERNVPMVSPAGPAATVRPPTWS